MSDVLEEFEGPLTADFQRHYGIRLLTAVREREFAELLDLVLWLPRDSAFRASVEAKGDETKARQVFGWNAVEDILLGIANMTSHQTYVLQQVNSQRRVQQPKPIVGPRGLKPANSGSNATGIARALLAAQ